jgi:hypothetical protein
MLKYIVSLGPDYYAARQQALLVGASAALISVITTSRGIVGGTLGIQAEVSVQVLCVLGIIACIFSGFNYWIQLSRAKIANIELAKERNTADPDVALGLVETELAGITQGMRQARLGMDALNAAIEVQQHAPRLPPSGDRWLLSQAIRDFNDSLDMAIREWDKDHFGRVAPPDARLLAEQLKDRAERQKASIAEVLNASISQELDSLSANYRDLIDNHLKFAESNLAVLQSLGPSMQSLASRAKGLSTTISTREKSSFWIDAIVTFFALGAGALLCLWRLTEFSYAFC